MTSVGVISDITNDVLFIFEHTNYELSIGQYTAQIESLLEQYCFDNKIANYSHVKWDTLRSGTHGPRFDILPNGYTNSNWCLVEIELFNFEDRDTPEKAFDRAMGVL